MRDLKVLCSLKSRIVKVSKCSPSRGWMLCRPRPGSHRVYRSHKHSLQGFQLGFQLKSFLSDLLTGLERSALREESSSSSAWTVDAPLGRNGKVKVTPREVLRHLKCLVPSVWALSEPTASQTPQFLLSPPFQVHSTPLLSKPRAWAS